MGFRVEWATTGDRPSDERADKLAEALLVAAPEYGVYAVFVEQLLAASRALDIALARTGCALIEQPDLGRWTRRLEAELSTVGQALSGNELVPGARAIIDRIASVERDEPLLLLAHDFARSVRDPSGVGATGQLGRLILDRAGDSLRAGYLPDPFEPFFDAIQHLGLPPMLSRRLREEGLRAQSLNLRLTRDIHQTYIAA